MKAKQPIRVLLLEDNPLDAEMVIRELRRAGFEPDWQRVDTQAEFLKCLDPNLDIILSDHEMPQFNGPRALELLKESGLAVPFITVSGTIGEEVAVTSMKQGAADYLLKDRLIRLGPAVKQALEQTRLRKEHQQTSRRIAFQAQLLGAVGQAVVATDLEGAVLYLNPFAEQLYGWPAEEAVGKNLINIVVPEGDAEGARGIMARLRLGETWSGEYRARRRDATTLPVQITYSPIRDIAGRVTGFVTVSMDITARRQLEEQFLQAQKMEAVGQLAGGMAHDFNNILTVVGGYATLLQEGAINQMEAAHEILFAVERATGLSRQLLTFSRKQVIEPCDLDLNAVVMNVTNMLRRILGDDITLEVKAADDLPLIHADQGMLEQIIVNLAVNSRDAMTGGGRLEIFTTAVTIDEAEARHHPDAAAGPAVCLRVSDNGCGIPPKILARIFEPFFTTKEADKGTGLGLATVHGIVKQHRGWIQLTSEVGRGTTFRILFPVSKTGLHKSAPEPVKAVAEGGHETILLVDDEPALRAVVKMALQHYGYEVLEAGSGRQALSVFQESGKKIDLLLTDMVMPDGLSGKDLADRLRATAPDLPVLFTSGYSAEFISQGAVPPAGIRFLQKPFSTLDLNRTIRDCLRARGL
jgi:PAS domain S-box-containing protein